MKKMKAEVVEVISGDGYEVFARACAGEGSPAVKVEYGFSVGSDLGTHTFADAFAIAQVGSIDGDETFVPDEWQEEDYTANKIGSRRIIGVPKTFESWSPDEDSDEATWWDEYCIWVKAFCERVL